jgi:zinc/manganese transport system substrate-binding protein
VLISLQPAAGAAGNSPKPTVIATLSIIGDFAHQVGGDDITLTTLVGPDGDPHEYEPIPADSIKIAAANLILSNGLGLETWLDKLCDSAHTQAKRVEVTKGIAVRHAPLEGKGADSSVDPHAWQNVQDAVIMVNNIRDALIQIDPDHAAAFQSRAAAYDRQLIELDRSIAAEIETIPKAHRLLVTSHDAFGYFSQRYGLGLATSALESITTEAADPSARQIADVVDQIKSTHVPVIFLENIQNPKLIKQIAAEANVKVGPPLYSDSLGQPGSAGETYLKMMRYNADTLVQALKP